METLQLPAVDALLDAERDILVRLKNLLLRLGGDLNTVEKLTEVVDHLNELFLVVLVGEFNAGKSSVLNALFGAELMEEGPIPTTDKITVLRYGEQPMDRSLSPFLVERRYPSPLLRHLNLVDTPGTNSIIQQHQTITEDFVPRADLVLFITSYDRPLTESERAFLQFIREAWAKRLVFILNKADLARSEADLNQVLAHLRSGCEELLGLEPHLFPVSAEQAYASKTTDDQAESERLWEESRFAPLEAFITRTLAGPEQLTYKLNAPLDTAERMMVFVEEHVSTSEETLTKEQAQLSSFNTWLEEEKDGLEKLHERYIGEVDQLLVAMKGRGVQFFQDNITISKIKLLLDRDQFKEEFLRQVVGDTSRQIEEVMTDAVDRFLSKTTTLWNRILERLKENVRQGKAGVTGEQGAFAYNRTEVFHGVMREAERKIKTYDVQEDARRILENVRSSVDLFKYAGGGAAGLVILSGILIISTTLDALGGFGLVTSGVLGGAAATMLPRQRKRAIREFEANVEELRSGMGQALDEQFGRETNVFLDRVAETLRPYQTLVEREQETLVHVKEERDALQNALTTLRERVKKEVGVVGF